MVVDPKAAEFFRGEREKDVANTFCADCGTEGADWASISHGIYLSIGASGVHRSLGVRVSFVQSTSMDSWKPVHLRMMELGGNRRFADFLRQHGVPQDMPLREKYRTRAAAWYREDLRARAEGVDGPPPLEEGTGHLLAEDSQDHASAVLDQVFAAAPKCGDMTLGGIPASRSRSQACHRKRESRAKKAASFPDWVSRQIDRMTRSKGTRAAEKLKTMSTGNMTGFGPGDSVEEAFRQTSSRLNPAQRAAVAA